MICPRCNSILQQNYITEPPLCVACGFENYTHPLPKEKKHRDKLMSGLTSQLRYIGFSQVLYNSTITVRMERSELLRMGIKIIPVCPWDENDMEVAEKSSSKKHKLERTYKCSRKHRISLLSSTNGELRGWT